MAARICVERQSKWFTDAMEAELVGQKFWSERHPCRSTGRDEAYRLCVPSEGPVRLVIRGAWLTRGFPLIGWPFAAHHIGERGDGGHEKVSAAPLERLLQVLSSKAWHPAAREHTCARVGRMSEAMLSVPAKDFLCRVRRCP